MDSAALPSLTPLLDGVDRWGELLPLLPVLVALELILSADNAIALAAIARTQQDPHRERQALNIGIGLAFVLRIALILMAQWVLAFRPIQLMAAAYLLWLFIGHLRSKSDGSGDTPEADISTTADPTGSLLRTVSALAFTDLAFSIDSVATAVAISDQLILVVTGALIGVIALRFTSGLFVRWLEIFPRLETAGYIAVGLVGLKLFITLLFTTLHVPEWFTLTSIIALLLWGFSTRTPSASEPV
ncbi:MAG: TerC family protein [Synechococcus sp.]